MASYLVLYFFIKYESDIWSSSVQEWELLIGQAVGDLKIDTAKVNDVVPQWIDKDRAFDVFILQVFYAS